MADTTDWSGFSDIFDDSGSTTDSVDWSYDWGSAADAPTDFTYLQDIPVAAGDYEQYFGSPDSYSVQGYDDSWVAPAYSGDYPSVSQDPTQFVGPQQPTLWDDLKSAAYGAEDWTKKHSTLTSGGVGLLSFLSSAAAARKQKKQQQEAYDAYMAAQNARNAKLAQQNAAWVPTEFRTRNSAVAGPTVADRYGISSRGSGSVNRPSNYDYFTRNRVQLARGGLAGLARPKQPHITGSSGGQDDDVPAMLSDGEYVMDAETVSALGDGNNEAGAAKLDQMRNNIRSHKRSGPLSKIPPKAKAPEAYLAKKGK